MVSPERHPADSIAHSLCPLCGAGPGEELGRFWRRRFIRCPDCQLVFVPREEWPTPAAERARYARHDNQPGNPDYVRYLEGVADQLARLPTPARRILDFGSGSEAVLTGILRARGYDCTPYDPLFGLTLATPPRPFEAIIACEVLEHLREPKAELARLRSWLAPPGYLLVRTELRDGVTDLGQWTYAGDETHLLFFHTITMRTVAEQLGRSVLWCDGRHFTCFGPS